MNNITKVLHIKYFRHSPFIIGNATWECEDQKTNGKWKSGGPDLTKCRSKDIQNLKDRVSTDL